MPAIVRVKRRIDDDSPQSALVINCKKRKTETDDDQIESKNANQFGATSLKALDEVSTIFKFAGTVEKNDSVTTQLERLTKDDAKQMANKIRPKPLSIRDRNRDDMRNQSHENRFKIVNCFRESVNQAESSKLITVVDIETNSDAASNTKNLEDKTGSSSNLSESNEYVYDVYLPENESNEENLNEYLDDNYNNISIRPFDDLFYQEPGAENSDSDVSEDSNCENYFANDYPDEEDDDSIRSDDMRRAVRNINLDGEDDLSSDDEDQYRNGFAYSIDAEAIGFEDDIDYCDVNRYGEAYARYKAKVIKKDSEEVKSLDSDDYDSDCEYKTMDKIDI